MKSLEFIYQETQIHFALQNEGGVMVNATEMAKLFNKRVDVFLKTDHAKAFIKVAEQTPNGGRSDLKITDNRGHMGIYFERRLALKFAAWLSPEFEVWVFSTLDEILFGNYKKHWDAHIVQEQAKETMVFLKSEMLKAPTPEMVAEYFEAKNIFESSKNIKSKAIKEQYKLF